MQILWLIAFEVAEYNTIHILAPYMNSFPNLLYSSYVSFIPVTWKHFRSFYKAVLISIWPKIEDTHCEELIYA